MTDMGKRRLGPVRVLGLLGLLGLGLLVGCAAAPFRAAPPPPVVDDAADAQELREALAELQEHKNALVMPRAESSCQPMCRLGELICRASERLCAVAARHPGDPTYAKHCRSAETDCREAQGDCDRCQ
jgi:hypothetical protein